MARINWDVEGKKFYELGVSKGVLFVKDSEGYGAGVPWYGLTAVNENPTGGEAQDLWADDILYASFRSAKRSLIPMSLRSAMAVQKFHPVLTSASRVASGLALHL